MSTENKRKYVRILLIIMPVTGLAFSLLHSHQRVQRNIAFDQWLAADTLAHDELMMLQDTYAQTPAANELNDTQAKEYSSLVEELIRLQVKSRTLQDVDKMEYDAPAMYELAGEIVSLRSKMVTFIAEYRDSNDPTPSDPANSGP